MTEGWSGFTYEVDSRRRFGEETRSRLGTSLHASLIMLVGFCKNRGKAIERTRAGRCNLSHEDIDLAKLTTAEIMPFPFLICLFAWVRRRIKGRPH